MPCLWGPCGLDRIFTLAFAGSPITESTHPFVCLSFIVDLLWGRRWAGKREVINTSGFLLRSSRFCGACRWWGQSLDYSVRSSMLRCFRRQEKENVDSQRRLPWGRSKTGRDRGDRGRGAQDEGGGPLSLHKPFCLARPVRFKKMCRFLWGFVNEVLTRAWDRVGHEGHEVGVGSVWAVLEDVVGFSVCLTMGNHFRRGNATCKLMPEWKHT